MGGWMATTNAVDRQQRSIPMKRRSIPCFIHLKNKIFDIENGSGMGMVWQLLVSLVKQSLLYKTY